MRTKQPNRVLGPYNEQGVWRIIIHEDGKRSTRKFEFLEDALSLKQQLEQHALAADRLTIKEVIDRYREYLEKIKHSKPRSIDSALNRVKAFFPDGKLFLGELTPSVGITLYHALCQKYEAGSHHRMLTEAKTLLKWCVKNRWVKQNPLIEIEPEGQSKRGKKQLRYDEAKRWLKKALLLANRGDTNTREQATAAIVTLLFGLRASEIVSLLARDIDDEGKLLWVEKGKTHASKRSLEVPSVLQPLLWKLHQSKQPQDPLFGYHCRNWPRAQVKKICTLAEVPLVTAHGMRGLHSTLALQAGASPHFVAKSLGHVSVSTTLQHYAAPGSLQDQQRNQLMQKLQV